MVRLKRSDNPCPRKTNPPWGVIGYVPDCVPIEGNVMDRHRMCQYTKRGCENESLIEL